MRYLTRLLLLVDLVDLVATVIEERRSRISSSAGPYKEAASDWQLVLETTQISRHTSTHPKPGRRSSAVSSLVML